MNDTPRTAIRKSTAEKRISYFSKDIVQIPSHSPDSLNELELETHRPRYKKYF